jgi:hypothetical protein
VQHLNDVAETKGSVGMAYYSNGAVMKRSNPVYDDEPVLSDGVSRTSSLASIDLDKLTATGDSNVHGSTLPVVPARRGVTAQLLQ